MALRRLVHPFRRNFMSQADKAEVPPAAAKSDQKNRKKTEDEWKTSLSAEEYKVLRLKDTEARNKGYTKHKEKGVYLCKGCGLPLYNSSSKFDSGCGWPAFDDEIQGAVTRVPDEDGRRTEIVCSGCDGHLGHIFFGERFTAKNVRHCVNSISMNFQEAEK